jgi:hypothetical protein
VDGPPVTMNTSPFGGFRYFVDAYRAQLKVGLG